MLNALERDPDDSVAQSTLIAMLSEETAADEAEAGNRKRDRLATANVGESGNQSESSQGGQLIIGIGTGRSGSTSLTKFLQQQHGAVVSHERPPRLPWVPNTQRAKVHLRLFEYLLAENKLVGDVSHWWLPYLDYVFDSFPTAKVVALQRDREQTIRSFENIKSYGDFHFNHWHDHGGVGWRTTKWDECYPKYETKDRFEAIGQYWDEYYETVKEWRLGKPHQIFLAPVDILNSREGQDELLTFLGIDERVYASPKRYNQESVDDGHRLWS
jgi:hypothetical protein